ncbi:hypothetical protein Anas_10885 [Armadillidium nasatum]|uniref:Uncharacterized protein n=1 Tax=Armadillidium nasatum TaxID=96803 RepID=A0A5N5TD23_9CRUS|nr:hypothetical protein Anas_10885 [Armadillidium nasatum]
MIPTLYKWQLTLLLKPMTINLLDNLLTFLWERLTEFPRMQNFYSVFTWLKNNTKKLPKLL